MDSFSTVGRVRPTYIKGGVDLSVYQVLPVVKTLTVILLLIIALASVASLVSGASVLSMVLPGGLPVGNMLAALGLVSPAALALFISTSETKLRVASLAMLWAALAWLPVSIILAGNLPLNFIGWRGTVWMGLTILLVLGVLTTLLLGGVYRLVLLRQKAGDNGPGR